MSLSELFKSLFSRKGSTEGDAESAEKANIMVVPSFNRGMPIEILETFDTPQLLGRLSSITSSQLVITRIPGEMSLPVFEPGTTVLIRGYDMGTNPILLRCTVSRSSILECVMGSWALDNYANQRSSVRFPVAVSANIYAMEDKTLSRPQPCTLINISTGGACVTSTFDYPVGLELRLRVELIDKGGHTSYICQVMRATERSEGGFEYGLLFAQLDKRKESALLHDIETIQKETEKKLLS